jgi:sugar phosphate permease
MRAAWIAFAIASTFFLFEFVTRIEPGLATDAIAHFYRLTDADLGTLASLFFWVYAPMQIAVGVLLDRYGARRFVLLGSLTCAGGMLIFAATDSVIVGGFGRGLTGFGAAFAFVAALWLINHWFAPERFALLSGAVNAVGMLGAAIGAVALSDLITFAGWRVMFLGTGAAGMAIFLVALLFLREPPSPAATATTGPGEHIRQSLAGVLGHPRSWVIAIVSLLYYMPVNVYAGLWGTTELMKDHHLARVSAETAVSMIFWGTAAGSVAGGWLSDTLGHRKYLVFFGAVLTGLAYAGVLYLPGSELTVGALLFVAGFFGGLEILCFAMGKEGLPNRLAGTAVAFVNMVGIAGALVFQPLVGYLADITGGDFHAALTSVPICAGLAALLVLTLPEYRHPEHRPGARNPQDAAKAAVAAG